MKTFQTVLACLVLAGVGIAQSNSSGPSLTTRPASPVPAAAPGETSSVAPDAAVITVQGLCDKTVASSAASTDCKTVITRAEFEKLVNAIQPNMPDAKKRQLATGYVNLLFFAQKAHEAGLDRGPDFDEKLSLVRLQFVASLGNGQVHKDAAKVTDAEVEAYYHDHISDYKTISFERLYIPKLKKIDPSAQNVNDPDLQKTREASQAEMKAEADKLRVRAAAGEDFSKLQQEAYDFGGYTQIKASNPKVDKARNAGLPASIFELKVGDVSEVFADPGGFVIYKIEAIEDVPVASVHDEISRTLAGGREKGAIESLQNSTKLDDAYFVPPAASPAAAAPPTLRGLGDAAPASTSPTSAPGKK